MKKKLDGMESVGGYDRKQICRYRETIYDALILKAALEKKRALVTEEPLKIHLQSKEFFDLGNRKTHELLKGYFKTNGNDVLQQVNPASMSGKRIRKLMKTSEKNGFSDLDMAALRFSSSEP